MKKLFISAQSISTYSIAIKLTIWKSFTNRVAFFVVCQLRSIAHFHNVLFYVSTKCLIAFDGCAVFMSLPIFQYHLMKTNFKIIFHSAQFIIEMVTKLTVMSCFFNSLFLSRSSLISFFGCLNLLHLAIQRNKLLSHSLKMFSYGEGF